MVAKRLTCFFIMSADPFRVDPFLDKLERHPRAKIQKYAAGLSESLVALLKEYCKDPTGRRESWKLDRTWMGHMFFPLGIACHWSLPCMASQGVTVQGIEYKR